MARPRDADTLLAPAVADTIRQLDLADEDAAAVRLARRYAAAIDDGGPATLNELGPKLLTVLESLGATPKARAAITKGTTASDTPSRLQALRAAR